MRYHGMSFALTLLSASALVAVAGCADIPKVEDEEVATVTVDVVGGNADVSPGREFSVPVGSDTLLSVYVSQEPNTRIAGVWVDGGRLCCAEEDIVRDTRVTLFDVRGNVTVTVELAKIDTVAPIVEVISPAAPEAGEPVVSIPVCLFGALEYKINKTMTSGYIKWGLADNNLATEDRDSLQVVRIPNDITKYTHNIGGWSYASPDGYLSEGTQKFDFTVSPVAGKRVSASQIAAPIAYTFEIQFTDSLGNKSNRVSRTVLATVSNKDCP